MSDNPYSPPTSQPLQVDSTDTASISRRGRTLNALAMFFLVACISWFVMMVIGRYIEGQNAPPLYRMLGFYLMIGIAPLLGILGSATILKRKRYPLALIGAICMSLPLIGPWCGITMPFGIWAIVLLVDPSIKAEFRTWEEDVMESDLADDLLANAARLDQLGEWEQAVQLYRDAAYRWPEHAIYAQNCINEINEKRES